MQGKYSNKKPSILGKGYLGQQTLGQRFAKSKYTNLTSIKQQLSEAKLLTCAGTYSAEMESV